MKEIYKVILYMIPLLGFRIINKHVDKWDTTAMRIWKSDLYLPYQMACMLMVMFLCVYGMILLIN